MPSQRQSPCALYLAKPIDEIHQSSKSSILFVLSCQPAAKALRRSGIVDDTLFQLVASKSAGRSANSSFAKRRYTGRYLGSEEGREHQSILSPASSRIHRTGLECRAIFMRSLPAYQIPQPWCRATARVLTPSAEEKNRLGFAVALPSGRKLGDVDLESSSSYGITTVINSQAGLPMLAPSVARPREDIIGSSSLSSRKSTHLASIHIRRSSASTSAPWPYG